MKKKLPGILFGLFLVLGLGLLTYPMISSYVNQVNGSHAIQVLADTLSNAEEGELLRQRELAQTYNQGLVSPETGDTEGYDRILDFGNGIMGYLEIPRIQISLPIYHGTEEETLSRGLGHMPQSAFPIGGEGNHAAIVGHTGLPSGKMLDDLVKLEEGDSFTVSILGECLHYCVDQILVVEPADSQALAPVAGEDYCTLVTCTPYGVNSHRLLVRGTRTLQAVETLAAPDPMPLRAENLWWFALISGLLLGIAVAVGLLLRLRR